MARLRFMAVALLALALAGNSTQTGRTQTNRSSVRFDPELRSNSRVANTGTATTANDRSCVIYSLTDMGYDADLGKWIAQTIPEMIEPSSWKEAGGVGVLRYYAPKNVLIVNHSAAVQAKVDTFFKKLKTSLPKTSHTTAAASKRPSRGQVVPADYHAAAVVRTSNPLPEPSSYPVPAPVKTPKHLFHFLIRYEGEGIIDDNVVKFMKGYVEASKDGSSQVPVQATARGDGARCGALVSPARVQVGPPSSSPPICISPAVPGVSPSTAPSPSVAQPKQLEGKKDDQKEKDDKESR